ncbi:hypothetical protein UCMB321_1941 [Pseudomonas batumici]|uniref:Uncharacterized protein n=1 Tax=Pseudomonas batumici TaxID=226910 RepID=A0A0C2IHI9_9PSED|nr:hypothetical protein UCMB321_1941 [Pseudomonas batumici]
MFISTDALAGGSERSGTGLLSPVARVSMLRARSNPLEQAIATDT